MHLIFDLDGTLVDSWPGIRYALRQAIEHVHPEFDLGPLNFEIGPPVRSMFQEALDIADAAQLDQLEAAFRDAYDGGAWKMTELYPCVSQTLSILRAQGILCYIVTNKPALATRRILAQFEIAHFFAAAVSRDSFQPALQDKTEMTHYLLNQHAIAPTTACYVGDSADDLRAAEDCGLEFVGVEYGYGKFDDTKPIRKVQSFVELLRTFEA